MWNLLSWCWQLAMWFLQVLWLNLYYIAGFAGFVRIAWMAFDEGRRYQCRRIREMLSRVRDSKREELPAGSGSSGTRREG